MTGAVASAVVCLVACIFSFKSNASAFSFVLGGRARLVVPRTGGAGGVSNRQQQQHHHHAAAAVTRLGGAAGAQEAAAAAAPVVYPAALELKGRLRKLCANKSEPDRETRIEEIAKVGGNSTMHNRQQQYLLLLYMYKVSQQTSKLLCICMFSVLRSLQQQ